MQLVWNNTIQQGELIKIDDFTTNIREIQSKFLGTTDSTQIDNELSNRGYNCSQLTSGGLIKSSDISNYRSTLDSFYDDYCNTHYQSNNSTVYSTRYSTHYNGHDNTIYSTHDSSELGTDNTTVYSTHDAGYDGTEDNVANYAKNLTIHSGNKQGVNSGNNGSFQ